MMVGTRRIVLALVALLLLAACGSGGEETGGGAAEGGDGGGGGEVTQLTVVTGSNDAGSNGPFIIGTEQGYFGEENLEVEVAFADDPRPALVGDSAQIAVLEVPFMVQAVTEGIDLVMFSGFRCREQYAIAVAEDIGSVADLDGQEVNLNGAPGDPVVDFRLELLKETGWDMSTIQPQYVDVPGASAAWLEVFLEGRTQMTSFFRSQTQQIEDAGGQIVVNQFIEWPNEVLVAKREFVEQNPEVVTGFLRAMLKSTEYFLDLSNKDAFLEMAKAQDFGTERSEADYEAGPILMCDNLYLEQESVERQLEVQEVPGAPSFDELADISALTAAQEELGLDNLPPANPPDPTQ